MPALTALAIATTTGCSLNWLLTGNESAESVTHHLAVPSDSVDVPLLNVTGSAGFGISGEQEYEVSKLPFSRTLLRELGVKPDRCHFIRARGDSMQPTIQDGSVVLIDTSRSKSRQDGVYVLMSGDDVRIKRVQFATFGGGLSLKSDNPVYSEEEIGRADIDQIKIVGKVVWVEGGV